MSHLNLFEMRARYSIAISILNKVRHWLIGRITTPIAKEKEILRESLDFELEWEKKIPQAILYNFQSYNNKQQAAAIHISEALTEASAEISEESGRETLEIYNSLLRVIDAAEIADIDKKDSAISLNLIKRAMHIIGSSDLIKPVSRVSSKVL